MARRYSRYGLPVVGWLAVGAMIVGTGWLARRAGTGGLADRPWASVFADRLGAQVHVMRHVQTGSEALFSDYEGVWWLMSSTPLEPKAALTHEWQLDRDDTLSLVQLIADLWSDAGLGGLEPGVAVGGDLSLLLADVRPGVCEYAILPSPPRIFAVVSCT